MNTSRGAEVPVGYPVLPQGRNFADTLTTPLAAVTDQFRDDLQQALGSTYSIEREITGGGMSRVFVSIEHALGRTVVIKVLRPELAAGVNRDRFRREIMLAAQLQHPHI